MPGFENVESVVHEVRNIKDLDTKKLERNGSDDDDFGFLVKRQIA